MKNKAQDDDVVMSLVEFALDLPERERRAYLERACAGDTELFDLVWDYVQWESRMQGFLLDPLYPPPPLNEHPFEPGELLDGRFRILREVAQGGMGVVYEAIDERLERRIAIKCAKTGYRRRLPPEVRNAREISHPNVCKIFEIHTASTEQGDLDFLSMEFLDGETLAERLRRGAIPEAEARVIARQLCEGLAQAHRNQVIHGDLKGSNVILTTSADGSTRAVITDFGMARRPESSQSAMQSGPLGGTPDYMAPELWKGEKASIVSDIYALGVILCELASGQRPSPPQVSSPAGLPERQVSRKPTAAHPRWERTIARCLDPNPARRFQTADEVAQAFEPSHTRRWFLAAAAAVVLAAASGVVTYRGATAPPETVQLALLPFTAPSGLDPIANAVLHDAAEQLARVKSSRRSKFVFIPLSTTLRRRVTTPEQARAALGASEVLSATLVQDNDRILLHAAISDARSKAAIRSSDAAYTPAQMKYAGVALAGMVTSTLRLPALVPKAVVNAAASQDYAAGLGAVRRDTGIDSAIAHFERAVAADPDSPLPYAGLSEAEWIKFYLTKDKLWLDRATQSIRQAEARNPDLAEVHRIGGLLKANAGWYEQAVVEYERAIELDPANGEAYRRLGTAYESNNQLEPAAAAYQRAIAANPNDYRSYQALGAFHFGRANYEEAGRQFARAVELAPDEPNAHFSLAAAYINLGRFAEAESELRRTMALHESYATLQALGIVLMYERREPEAIPLLLHALMLTPNSYVIWADLSLCYRRMNRPAEAAQAARRGLVAVQAEIASNPRNGYVRAYLAYLAAINGDRSRAESEAAQALQLAPDLSDAKWMAVLTYEAMGRRDASLAVLASAPTAMLQDLSRWPDVADLSKDSRFVNLLIARGVK
ncbi:MAG TPA: protein kinase [Bryobacteraceae bacterium]|nr:protein kinase [Bryobacteraceae bacterium]